MGREIRQLIRDIPDFPHKGILFRDITPLMNDAPGLRQVVEGLAAAARERQASKIICIESRGFLLGPSVALALGVGVVLARKPGKLPAATLREEYELEYGTDALEIHRDAVSPGERVFLVDDLLATGGTAAAVTRLVGRLGGEVVGCGFLVELAALKGRAKLEPLPVSSLIVYE